MVDIPLTAHHLRVTVRAETPIWFHSFRGSALRGALADQLRRLYCPESKMGQNDAFHQAYCPVCQLLSWEGDNDTTGDVRRPYALVPPPTDQNRQPAVVMADECFSFGLTLFGSKLAYLPYLILATRAMGEEGVGQRGADGRRGRFRLEQIDAINPLLGAVQPLYTPGAATIRNTTLPVTHMHVLAACHELLDSVAAADNQLTIEFSTPLRLIQSDHLVQEPHFFPLIKQIVLRVLDLCQQHGDGRPNLMLKHDLYPLADAVTLVENKTEWWDFSGYSSRLHQPQVMGGLIGRATYYTADWRPLLPWLVWAQSTQVGKNIVKGCGVLCVRGGKA